MNTSFIPLTCCAMATLLAACGDDGGSMGSGNVAVYESRGMLQCQSGGLSPQQSAMKLTNAGLDVLRSGCGVVTNVAYPAVCGAGTGDIALHEIRRESLPTAEQQG